MIIAPVETLHSGEGGSANLVEGLDGHQFAADVDDGGILGGGDAHLLEGSGMQFSQYDWFIPPFLNVTSGKSTAI